MPRISTIDIAQAWNRLKRRTHGYGARAPYRSAIASLTEGRMLELVPDSGETMRGLKRNITRAAREVNRPIQHGESPEGTLLVWLQDAPKRTR
jgi:hypothetical protein